MSFTYICDIVDMKREYTENTIFFKKVYFLIKNNMDAPIDNDFARVSQSAGSPVEPESYGTIRGAVHRLEIYYDGEVLAELEVPAGLQPEMFSQLAEAQQTIEGLRAENASLRKYVGRLERSDSGSKVRTSYQPTSAGVPRLRRGISSVLNNTKKTNIKEKKPKKNTEHKKIKKQ